MKKTIAWIMALVLCLGVMSAAVLAADAACPFTYSDGKIVGTYSNPGKYIEIWVNDACAGFSDNGTVEVNFRPKTSEDVYTVSVWENGFQTAEYPIDTNPAAPTATAAPTEKPASTRTVTIDDACRYATVTGDFSDLYVRVAIIVESSGESGLFLTQVPVNVTGDTGTIVIPVLDIPNVTVTGVNVMLVATIEEITSPRPKPLAVDTFYFN